MGHANEGTIVLCGCRCREAKRMYGVQPAIVGYSITSDPSVSAPTIPSLLPNFDIKDP